MRVELWAYLGMAYIWDGFTDSRNRRSEAFNLNISRIKACITHTIHIVYIRRTIKTSAHTSP